MIQKLLKEIEGRDVHITVYETEHGVDIVYDMVPSSWMFKAGKYKLVDRATYDRVCAALVEAVRQRDHWTGCALMHPLETEKTIKQENETLAKILTGKTKE